MSLSPAIRSKWALLIPFQAVIFVGQLVHGSASSHLCLPARVLSPYWVTLPAERLHAGKDFTWGSQAPEIQRELGEDSDSVSEHISDMGIQDWFQARCITDRRMPSRCATRPDSKPGSGSRQNIVVEVVQSASAAAYERHSIPVVVQTIWPLGLILRNGWHPHTLPHKPRSNFVQVAV